MHKDHTGTAYIAEHVRGIPRSGIRDFFDIVQSTPDAISLGVGEPDFTTPWHIREAAIYALERGRTTYTSNLGSPQLRNTISKYVEKNFGVSYDPQSEIIVTVGVSEAIDIALRAIINPGDHILYHEPCYVSYHPSIILAHGIPVPVSTKPENDFQLTAADIEAAITPKTKALLLNFPTNPTGAHLPASHVAAIAEVCRRHNLLVLTDEIYSELTYEGEHTSIAAQPGMKERTIFLHGFSKAYAMTGFRIGYACAPPPLTEAMMRIHQYSMLCASIIAQEAANEALLHGREAMIEMRENYRLRRNFITASFNEMGLPCFLPKGAFYAFPDITPTGLDSKTFALRLLKEKKVAVVPGTAFGPSGAGHIRASYATAFPLLEEAMRRIKNFLTTL
jgi:aminotransferase